MFVAGHHVQPTVEQRRSAGDAGLPVLVVAELSLAGLRLELDPVEIAVGDEVDHAGDRIGAINRRGAAGDDLNPLNQHLGNDVDIDDTGYGGWRHALPVE